MPPALSGQTGHRDRSDWSPVKIGNDRRTHAQEGPRQSKRMHGCFRIGRPPRTPSDIMETKEEQEIEVGKVRVWRKDKDDKKIEIVLIFDRLNDSIGRDPLYL